MVGAYMGKLTVPRMPTLTYAAQPAALQLAPTPTPNPAQTAFAVTPTAKPMSIEIHVTGDLPFMRLTSPVAMSPTVTPAPKATFPGTISLA